VIDDEDYDPQVGDLVVFHGMINGKLKHDAMVWKVERR
jgi:hypothetical protein